MKNKQTTQLLIIPVTCEQCGITADLEIELKTLKHYAKTLQPNRCIARKITCSTCNHTQTFSLNRKEILHLVSMGKEVLKLHLKEVQNLPKGQDVLTIDEIYYEEIN